MAYILESKVKAFFWKSIIYQYRLFHIVITDNDKQFDNRTFKEFYANLHIQHCFISNGHPQMNEKAEVMNQTNLQGLKTRLDEVKDIWTEQLASVLCEYHTTPWTLINETLFSLVFDTEMMILVKIGLLTIGIEHFDELSNSICLRANFDLLMKTRDKALLYIAVY